MKKILNLIILVVLILISSLSYSQCAKLYIKEQIGGTDPVCWLERSGYLEICEGTKKITGCPSDFYIINAYIDMNGFIIYEFAMDKVYWAPKYGDITINPNNQRVSVNIQGRYAVYTYFNQTEMELKNKLDKIAAENQKKIDIKNDYSISVKIKNELKKNINQIDFNYVFRSYNSLKYPSDYTEIKKEIVKQSKKKDELTEISIIKTINNSTIKPYEIAKLYSQIINKDDYLNLKSDIVEILSNYYKDSTIQIEKEELDKIIKSNIEELKVYESGNYDLKCNSQGELFINSEKINQLENPFKIKIGEFDIPINAISKINILKNKSDFENSKNLYYVFFKRNYLLDARGKLYKSNFMNITGFSKYPDIRYSTNIDKNRYKLYKQVSVSTSINGKKYFENYISEKFIEEGKIKKKIPKMIWRSASIIFWGTVITTRSIEYSKLNKI